ncbi:AMP binding protein [Amanita muscaria]
MAPKIYSSPVPSLPIVERSLYSHLFASANPNLVGPFPASAPAFLDAASGTTVTRAALKQLTLAFGYGLLNHPQTAAKRGETILIFSANSLSWPVVMYGAVAAGLRCTLANSAYNARELEHQYKDSGARLVLTTEEGLPIVQETLRGLGFPDDQANKKIVVLGNTLEWAGGPAAPRSTDASGLIYMDDLLKLGILPEEEKFEGNLSYETVFLCYSSGTTGKPKGVETTHRNILAVLDLVMPVFPKLTPGVSTILGVLPFYHIYGLVKLLFLPFACGVPMVVQPRFDPVQFCANIERYNITISLIVPPVLVVLARHPAVDQYDMSSLEVLFSGAAPLGAALTKAVLQRLLAKRGGKGNLAVLQGYGLTETSPTATIVPIQDGLRKIGSVGILLPNLQARLVADENGDIDAEEGQPGELWLRGPTVMKGYLNNKAATEDSITSDEWFKTGDIAMRDDEGFYYIVDRRKELIKYKGFQVPPAELESVLLTHPEIADAAVIGIHSTKAATELPRAYVVHAKPDEIGLENQKVAFCREIETWIQKKVARHKYLRGGVVILDIIPKSAAGKILRRELRERAKQELVGQDSGEGDFSTKL